MGALVGGNGCEVCVDISIVAGFGEVGLRIVLEPFAVECVLEILKIEGELEVYIVWTGHFGVLH